MTVLYFGPEWGRKQGETQIKAPLGTPCGYCDEKIERDQAGTLMNYITLVDGKPVGEMKPVHYECQLRQMVGSVAHIQGVCSCNIPGSREDDPPGASLREGALLAVAAWRQRQ